MNTYLFIYAHLDDETILSYGTIRKFSRDNNIILCCLCGLGTINKSNQIERFNYFNSIYGSMKNISFEIFPYYDLHLTYDIVKTKFDNVIAKYHPDYVFTHSIEDPHFEHRMIANQSIISCRKTLNTFFLKGLFHSHLPTFNWTYNSFGSSSDNYFVDIGDFIEDKKKSLELYQNCKELPKDQNDLRSIDSIIDHNRQCGRTMNVKYCESYIQKFRLDQ